MYRVHEDDIEMQLVVDGAFHVEILEKNRIRTRVEELVLPATRMDALVEDIIKTRVEEGTVPVTRGLTKDDRGMHDNLKLVQDTILNLVSN